MKKISVVWVLLGAGLALAQTDSKAAGHWQGKIQIPDRELGITVDLAKSAKGVWIGSMSVIGTSSMDVPLADITIEGTAVRFAANLPERASFDGQLAADGNSVSGKASNANGEAPFAITRSGEANVKVPPASSALSKEFEGNWEGTINAGGKTLRVGLKLSPAADGSATGTLIAIDQGNQQFPVTTVTIQDKELKLDVRAVAGAYHGTLSGGEIAGEWEQGPTRVPLIFKRAAPEAKKQ
jgi:hypothetical protein